MNKSPFISRVLAAASVPPVSRVVYESSHMQRASSTVEADFTDSQLAALRMHVLPLFEAVKKPEDPVYQGREAVVRLFLNLPEELRSRPPAYAVMNELLHYLGCMKSVVDAVLMKGSPASRAAALKKSLGSSDWKNFRKPTPPVKFPALVLNLSRKIPTRLLTERGEELMSALSSPYFKLLRKSWGFILKECDREFHSILKQVKLNVVVKNSVSVVLDALKRVDALQGWSFKTEKEYGNYEVGIATSPDNTRRLTVMPPYDDDKYYRIAPSFTVPSAPNLWRSWARLGVDDGAEDFSLGTPVEDAVEKLFAKIDSALAKHADKLANGKDYDFGGTKHRLTDTEFQAIVDTIKKRGYWTTGPGGFGTYTTYKMSPRTGTLSQTLTDAVGVPVYWTKEDRD